MKEKLGANRLLGKGFNHTRIQWLGTFKFWGHHEGIKVTFLMACDHPRSPLDLILQNTVCISLNSVPMFIIIQGKSIFYKHGLMQNLVACCTVDSGIDKWCCIIYWSVHRIIIVKNDSIQISP